MALKGPKTRRYSNATNAYDLLTDVRAYNAEEPKRLDMHQWIVRGAQAIKNTISFNFGIPETRRGPVCGTLGCIAGNTMVLTGKPFTNKTCFNKAIKVLSGSAVELSHLTPFQEELDKLFCNTEVDAQYGTAKYARIVNARIRKFQQKHKAELKAVEV